MVGLVGSLVAAGVADAGPPSAFRCGKGGEAKPAVSACKCPTGKVARRDPADDAAVCVATSLPAGKATLTVVRLGRGSVTSNPVGIDCGTDCSETVDAGTKVVLTAAGSGFVSWTGACDVDGPTCTTTVAASKRVTATFATEHALPSAPTAVSAAGDTVSAWVTTEDGTLTRIDPVSGEVTGTVAGVGAASVVATGNFWVGGATLTELSAGSTSLLLNVDGIADVGGMAFDGQYLWVSSTSANTLSRVDPTVGTVTAVVTGLAAPEGVAFDGKDIWVANRSGYSVSRVDPSTATVIATVGNLDSPSEIAFDGARLWITGARLARLDPATLEVFTLAFAADNVAVGGGSVWITSGDELARLDPETRSVTAVTTSFVTPTGLAFDGSDLWVASYDDASVWRIEGVSSRPPAGYRCGKGGKAAPALEACTCPKKKIAQRDADDRAVCVATPKRPKSATKQPLNVAVVGAGSVTSSPAGIRCGTDCTEKYRAGTTVVLTATATAPATFTGWSGGGCTGTGTCTTTANAATTVTASFATTVTVGAQPSSLAFDGTSVWVVNVGDGTLSRIDPTTETVTGTFASVASPSGIAFDGTNLWVVGGGAISRIDPSDGAVIAAYTEHVGGLAFDRSGVWVTHHGDPNDWVPVEGVSRFDATDLVTTATISDAAFYLTTGLAFDGTNLWLSAYGPNTVFRVDPVAGGIAARVKIPNPGGVAFDGTSVWVDTLEDAWRIDPKSDAVIARVAAGVHPSSPTFDKSHAWFVNRETNTVTRVDRKTNLATATLTGFAGPSAVVDDGTSLWVANSANGTVSRLERR